LVRIYLEVFVFRAPLSYPDVIYAGMSISKIGSSSVTYQISIFCLPRDGPRGRIEITDDGQLTGDGVPHLKCCAVGRFIHVFVDPVQNNRPRPIPERMQKGMNTILVPASAL
jgi:acyl-CoA thioester hydrolase